MSNAHIDILSLMRYKKSYIYIIAVVLILLTCVKRKNDQPSELKEQPIASIKIKPYNKNDRGKFWKICIPYSPGIWDKPVAYFDIVDHNSISGSYTIDFIHLKGNCNLKNILVSFTNRHTPHTEREWLHNLEPDSLSYVRVRVKSDWEKDEYVFDQTIPGTSIEVL